ncbi:hypothetical protein O0I10_012262 [Lichtheimia ornata]|uniref:Phosphodiesterase n=1 Tax=Lichtheimia ornata TaxID=688661 RepID=A0AAD7US37_9FUNG|nr:uncharacterized protein O0I10_012262 [Lichtheimia ornata]KAJ8652111.1 hypothetical protein O0I10_012262 [Lichtheimia ornata]
MDPLHCSVVVCYQPAPTPYILDTIAPYEYNDQQPSYTPLLQSVFGKVFIHSNPTDALEQVKQHESPTILLLDLDATTIINDDNDDDTVYTPSCSSSCSTASSSSAAVNDTRIAWIRKSSRELDQHSIDVPIIACSTNDDTAFMLDCIHAGAVDYLLKPLHMDVIKTMFLKLHRSRHDSKMHQGTTTTAPAPPFLSNKTTTSPTTTTGCQDGNNDGTSTCLYPDNHPLDINDDGLQVRIKEIFNKDDRFTQSLMAIYANQRVPRTRHHRGLSSERASLLRHKVSSWDFNPFEFGRDDLIHCSYLIFEQVLVSPELPYSSITNDQLYDFIVDLSGAYHNGNPYHNFAHAVDVLQCVYYFLCSLGVVSFANSSHVNMMEQDPLLPSPQQRTRMQHLLQPKHVFALLTAALGHDAAHPGVNNVFLVNTSSPLALLFNDRSVLESFHSMALFQIMKKHGFDRLGDGPGSTDYQEFRKIVVSSILATDMSLHGDYVEKIKTQASRLANVNVHTMDPATLENERLLICSALIKCADISNVTRPFLRAVKWAELLVQECVQQGDLERAMGMPSVPMNDRDKVILEDSQIGFIKFVALELFDSVRQVMPEMSFTVEYIRENLKRWEHRKQCTAEEQQRQPPPTSTTTTTTSSMMTKTDHVMVGCKRRSSSLDYKAVEVLRKRLSLENGRHVDTVRRRGSAGSVTDRRFYKLQPAYARLDHEVTTPETAAAAASSPSSEWSHDDPVHCQCAIQ